MYTTTSDSVNITDRDEVEQLVDEYYFTVPPTIAGQRLSFFADSEPNKGFDVYNTVEQKESVVQEFLTELSEYLNEDLEIKCVEVEGDGIPETWKWTVTQDGDVSKLTL